MRRHSQKTFGLISWEQDNYPIALEYVHKTLAIFQEQ